MPNITFITKAGVSETVSADSGSVMELALANNIAGIGGNCGGVCSCATCHVHVAPGDMGKAGEASDLEKDMLEFTDEANAFSRLCCQIPVSADVDGLTVTVVND